MRHPKFNEQILVDMDVREGCCAYCGIRMNEKQNDPHRISVEHFFPLSNGGTNCYLNRLPCCRACNHWKGDRSWNDFLQLIQLKISVRSGVASNNEMKRLRHMEFHIRFTGILMERYKKEIYSYKPKIKPPCT